jgi:hypothetical protein
MNFYDRVKRLANKNSHRSLQEFILGLGINHDSYYTQKRAGKLPRADEALAIAQALGTTVEFLIMGITPKALTDADIINELLDECLEVFGKYKKQTSGLLKKNKKINTGT